MLLTSGVDQLNRNANQALIALAEKIAKLEDDLKNTQDEIVQVKDQTHVLQEHMDRELGVFHVHQSQVQRLASEVTHYLLHARHELATAQEILQNAEKDRTERSAEAVADQKALDAAKADYQSLKEADGQLRERLASLRAEFKKTHNYSAEMLRRIVK
jgi:hypothetical protein